MLDYIQKEQKQMKDLSLYQKINQLNLTKG